MRTLHSDTYYVEQSIAISELFIILVKILGSRHSVFLIHRGRNSGLAHTADVTELGYDLRISDSRAPNLNL